MTTPLRVLIVEDSEDDTLLIIDELRDAGYVPTFERVETREALEAALDAAEWDIIIADYTLPNLSGLDALDEARRVASDCPFIIVSGQISEETAVNAMRAGANDYVLKGNLTRLVPAVERELREADIGRRRREAEEALQAERQRTAAILESITDAFAAVDRDWRFTYINGEAERLIGKNREYLIGKNAWEEFPDVIGTPLQAEFRRSMAERVPVTVDLHYEPLGRWFSVRAYPSPDGLSIYGHDITARKLAEDALERSRDELEEALNRERNFSLLLQRALLPSAPTLGSDFNVAAEYVPAYQGREIGGDFYDVFRLGQCQAAILIGDVSGKGLEAAATAATARSTLHAFVHETGSAAEALKRTNSVLYSRQPEFGPFVTVFLAVIDLCAGTVTYSNAGHPSAAVCRNSGSVEFLELGQLPLLVPEEQYFEEHHITLAEGDKLVAYTDGITEARRDCELLDIEGIQQVLNEHAGLPVADMARAVVGAATAWANGRLHDDAAVVVVERQKR